MNDTNDTQSKQNNNILKQLDETLQARKQALNTVNNTNNISYVQSLYAKGTEAILKKVIEEAGEVLMAAKDIQNNNNTIEANRYQNSTQHMVCEIADLWFHTLILLHQHGLSSQHVLDELARREGKSGIIEKQAREIN
jgi:phosphoribosyl-ATP pyrophosphohydrolase